MVQNPSNDCDVENCSQHKPKKPIEWCPGHHTNDQKEEKHFNKLSAEAREKVDERLLNSYDRIRKNYRNGLAVVPVERDACGGCFNAIPPQKQSEIKQRKKIIICENCGRILVDDDLNNAVEVK